MGRSADRPGVTDPGTGSDPAVRVLERLGLTPDPELLDLVDLGARSAAAARVHDSPELLADFLDFARRRLVALDVGPLAPDTVETLARLLVEDRDGTDEATAPDLVDRALARLPHLAPPGEQTLGPVAASYLDHVLAGDREAAIAVVVESAHAGTPVATILTDVLEAAQHEIGRRWEDGEVTITQEHFCTAVTQLALTALQPHLFARQPAGRRRRRLVAVQPGGSLHEVGLRMVVDLLEHEGWDTTYLGSEDDPRRVVDALADRQAAVLAISASMPADVARVAAFVRAVRADPRTSRVRVIVGGRAFLVAPRLAGQVGADGLARDAREAVALCAAQTDDVAV